VDVLKKTLHRQWSDEVEMRTGVDSLLGRVAEFAPLDPKRRKPRPRRPCRPTAAEKEVESRVAIRSRFQEGREQAAGGTSTVKSVRIALARLDRMMNTVGSWS